MIAQLIKRKMWQTTQTINCGNGTVHASISPLRKASSVVQQSRNATMS